MVCAIMHVGLELVTVTLDVSCAGAVTAFLGVHPLVEWEASGQGLVDNVFIEFIIGCGGGEESRFLAGGTCCSSAIPFAAGQEVTVCVLKVATHIGELGGERM